MKHVYIAHPFQGKDENRQKVEAIILDLLKQDPNTLYISPIHATGFYYFAMSYEEGMKHCFEMLCMCDELWLCPGWESSIGCNLEKEFAEKHDIPIKYL
jgi:hypothetical protein